jgi:hypothetical protein
MTTRPNMRERLATHDWAAVESALNTYGHAELGGLLTPRECQELRGLYSEPEHFRSFVDLAGHGYGDRGDYRYFARPLPSLVDALRTHLYARLAPIANHWWQTLGREAIFARGIRPFLALCRQHGQERPTPLVLRYREGGYNCLHQDLYGEIAFPLQVAISLSRPGEDFTGGEFLLTEQRPRMQSRGEAIPIGLGCALIFANRERPVQGRRGPYAVQTRHGVSRIRSGERYTLGLIFHDAR